MHASSYELMARLLNAHPCMESALEILDVGSLDVNGTYKALVKPPWTYLGCDVVAGPNVDVVMSDPDVLPFEAGRFDAVISGQTLEHVARPWRLVPEMARVLKLTGRLILIAPMSGPSHHAPQYWHLFPDGLRVLADDSGLRVMEAGGNETTGDAWLLARKPIA